MKLQFAKILFATVLAALVFTSCKKEKVFPDTPALEWEGHEIISENTTIDEIVLNLAFTDGDGDIGSADQGGFDTCNAQAYDLFIRYFERVGGNYEEVFPRDTANCLYFHQRFPDLMPEGQNKILEGNIFAPFIYLGYPENSNVDSVKFELTLKDRAGNQSNVVTSPAIAIPPQ